MSIKQFGITITAAFLLLVALVVVAFVRINGIADAQGAKAPAALDERLTAVELAIAELKGQENELVPTPTPVVYVVNPITPFAANCVDACALYAIPDANGEQITTLEAGVEVVVNGVTETCYYITLADGTTGYVLLGGIAKIPEPTPEPTPPPEAEPEPALVDPVEGALPPAA